MMAGEIVSSSIPWLTLSIFVPIMAGLLLLLVGRDERPELTRWLALGAALLGFLDYPALHRV